MLPRPMKLLGKGLVMAALVIAAIVLGQPRTAATAATSSIGQSERQASTAAPGATETPDPVPVLPSSRPIYKGHTIEEIAADPKLLEEVLALGDYIAPVRGQIGEDGVVDPTRQDGSSDTACPNGEECP